MGFLNGAPVPKDPLTQNGQFISWNWVQWLMELVTRVDATPQLIGRKDLTGQSATILSTPLTTPTLASGLYRFSYYGRVTTAAATSSSFQVTLGWTDGAIPLSVTDTAQAGNTTGSFAGRSIPIHLDGGSPVTYAVTYASNPAAAMRYSLYVALESVAA